MAKKIVVPKRRRREGKTNYAKRIRLLEGNHPRLVVRKTSRYVIAQIVESREAKDRVVAGVTSKKLQDYGWKKGFKSIPACYLTGMLIGKLAKEKKISYAILDIGLHRITKGSRLMAVVKGANKFIEVPYSEEVAPSEDRIYGKHIDLNFESKIKEIENKILSEPRTQSKLNN